MALLTLPAELHLQIVSYCADEDLNNLIQTHPSLYARLHNELHNRAVCWSPANGAEKDSIQWSEDELSGLGWAIRRKRVRHVDYLLRQNISCIKDNGEWPLLGNAFQFSSAEVISKLLEYALNYGFFSMTPEWSTKLLAMYLEIVPDKFSRCPHYHWHPHPCECRWAVSESELEVVKYLLELGADSMGFSTSLQEPDEIYDDPFNLCSFLQCGIYEDHTEPFTFRARNEKILKLLVDAGADIHKTCTDDYNYIPPRSALFTACYDNKFPPGVVRELLKHGADPNCCHPGSPPPLINILNGQLVRLAKAELLVEYGADVTLRDDDGNRLIDKVAMYEGTYSFMKKIISVTPVPNLDDWDRHGNTALQAAVEYGKLHHARLLLKAGADARIKCKGKSLMELPEYDLEYGGVYGGLGIVNGKLDLLGDNAWDYREDPNYTYDIRLANRIHFLTNHGLETHNLELIPTDEAHSHAVRRGRVESRYLGSSVQLSVSFKFLWKALLNIKDALEQFPDRGGRKGMEFRKQLRDVWYVKDMEGQLGWQEWNNWSSAEWDIDRQGQWWMKDNSLFSMRCGFALAPRYATLLESRY
ncbi:ankyrin [Lophium mytilinum]|uniref:Ankyrin n=1 Tax=Lophium mytilinum TaxID=390894 RepID=A0A6A6QI58_9PEZI|nr:ankyrin [Lophium mytilinum]